MIHSVNNVDDPLQRDCSCMYYFFLYLEWRVLLAAAPSRSLCSLESNKRKAQVNIMLYSKWGHEGISLPVAFFGDGTSSPVAFFWYYFAFPHLSGCKSQITNLCLWITNTNEIWECSTYLSVCETQTLNYTRYAWAGGTFFPVVVLCQFFVLTVNKFWVYILLMYLEYHTVVVLC